MPAYHLHRLSEPGGDPSPTLLIVYCDEAAMRWAIGAAFPGGCDVWQGHRYVGRVHGPADPVPARRKTPEG